MEVQRDPHFDAAIAEYRAAKAAHLATGGPETRERESAAARVLAMFVDSEARLDDRRRALRALLQSVRDGSFSPELHADDIVQFAFRNQYVAYDAGKLALTVAGTIRARLA